MSFLFLDALILQWPSPPHTQLAEREKACGVLWILTVSSLQMEWICVPNITAVKVRKRMASRQRKISSSTDTPGEKSLHSGHRKRGKKRQNFCFEMSNETMTYQEHRHQGQIFRNFKGLKANIDNWIKSFQVGSQRLRSNGA